MHRARKLDLPWRWGDTDKPAAVPAKCLSPRHALPRAKTVNQARWHIPNHPTTPFSDTVISMGNRAIKPPLVPPTSLDKEAELSKIGGVRQHSQTNGHRAWINDGPAFYANRISFLGLLAASYAPRQHRFSPDNHYSSDLLISNRPAARRSLAPLKASAYPFKTSACMLAQV